MPKMPCDVISLDVEDSMGYHVVDYYGEMVKTRMSADGEMLEPETEAERSVSRDELFNRILKELNDGQGCRFKGFLEV
jgi:hypothetical protein